jgi:hypothetical protein
LVVKGAENHILKAYLEGVTEGRECANDYSVTLVNQRHHRYVIYIAYFFLQFYFSNSVFLFSRELFPQLIASFQKIILLSSVGFEEYVVGEENSFFSFQELHDLIKMQKIGISSVPALWVWVPREAKNRYQFSAHSVGMSTESLRRTPGGPCLLNAKSGGVVDIFDFFSWTLAFFPRLFFKSY